MTSEERLRELEEKYEGYTVYDNQGEKIGKVDDLFVDEADREEYIGVKIGLLGRKSTLVPTEIVRVNEADKRIEVPESKDHVKNAPSFDDDEDITPDYEERIRNHFGLETAGSSGQRGTYAAHSGSSTAGAEARGDEGYSDGEEEGSTEGSSGTSAATGTAASADFSRGSSSAHDEGGTTGSSPVTRETEETETYEEGGRTKVRRRIVREEIVEEDAQEN